VPFDTSALVGLAVAGLGGLAIGIERQWSGHAAGPEAHFAGLRTFTLVGLASGISGWLWAADVQGPALVVLAGLASLVVAAYVAASRRDVDGTTEVAAFVAIVAGVLAGMGHPRVASGAIAVTTLLLVEKSRLHDLVSRVDRVELLAGVRFAVMAAVVLPLLPEGPYGPLDSVRPRLLWAIVLFFSGLSAIGYVARRMVGAERGYAIAGTLGGLLSSTSVTLTFSRLSARRPSAAVALAAGTLGANVVLFPRVLVATAVLAPSLTAALWPAFILPAAIGVMLMLRGLRPQHPQTAGDEVEDRNPLQFVSALQMALLFQVVLFGVAWAESTFGDTGIYASAVVLGLADNDALTLSMARLVRDGAAAEVGALAIVIGALANTGVKLGLTLFIGRGRFRPLTGAGLAAMAVSLGLAVYWMATAAWGVGPES